MKKIIMFGIGAMCITSAMAEDFGVRPYIGANLNFDFASYSSELNDAMDYFGVDLSGSYFGLGAEGGIKFGNIKNIWNGGLAVAYDYVFNNSATISNPYIDSAETGFSAWNIGFDNYIRVDEKNNERTDLVLGLGIGQATERISIDAPGILTIDESDSSTVFVLKFGTNIQLNEVFDWYTTLRAFIPSDSADVESIISVQTGLKLNF